MNKRGEKTMWWLLLIPLLLILAIVFVKINYIEKTATYEATNEVFYNPLMGFAVNAESQESVGKNTLVYVDVTWREWEPEEGVYAIDELWEKKQISRWQEEGKHIVLRFICDYPEDEAHMDIPDWLYDMTQDGMFYTNGYGKGYAPEYSNPIFIERHNKALIALGEAFEDSGMVVYVEMGSLGHWGEWHMNYTHGTTRMPESSIREEYVKAYMEAFPNAKILARRPFEETAKYDLGVFNDMTGHPEDTREWLEWIEDGGTYDQPVVEEDLSPQPDIWENAPIGGEFTSSLSFDVMLDENLEETLELLKQSHTTFIGPKCPIKEETETYAEGVSEVLKTIGYRYGVEDASISYFKWSDSGNIRMEIANRGIAPIYFPWQMYLYIYDETGKLVTKSEVPKALTEIAGGESATVKLKNVPIQEGYSYWIGVENPSTNEPEVYLDMNVEEQDFKYQLFKL